MPRMKRVWRDSIHGKEGKGEIGIPQESPQGFRD